MRIAKAGLLLCALACCLCSCNKPKTCALAAINGYVMHHNIVIPYARVFLKTGAKEYPGKDSTVYDRRITGDAHGRYEISGLEAGDYFIAGYGYDSSVSAPVTGGTPWTISCEQSEKTYTVGVPVVE